MTDPRQSALDALDRVRRLSVKHATVHDLEKTFEDYVIIEKALTSPAPMPSAEVAVALNYFKNASFDIADGRDCQLLVLIRYAEASTAMGAENDSLRAENTRLENLRVSVAKQDNDTIMGLISEKIRLREALDKVENWLGNELFDDDTLDQFDCSQETRAENISDMIKQALTQPGEKS